MCQQIVCLHARKRKFYRHVSCVRLRQIDCKQEISILRKAERAAHVAVCLRQKRMFPHKLVPRQVTLQEAEIGKLAVDARGLPSRQHQPPALREIVLQKRGGTAVQRVAVGNHNEGIGTLSNGQPAVLDAAVLLHQPLVAVVMADASRAEALNEHVERFANVAHGCFIVRTVKRQIGRMYRMENQHIRLFAAVGKQIAQFREIVVECL